MLHEINVQPLKVFSMLDCYFHADLRKVMVEHLGTLDVVKVTTATLERVRCEFLKQNNILCKDLVSMLMD